MIWLKLYLFLSRKLCDMSVYELFFFYSYSHKEVNVFFNLSNELVKLRHGLTNFRHRLVNPWHGLSYRYRWKQVYLLIFLYFIQVFWKKFEKDAKECLNVLRKDRNVFFFNRRNLVSSIGMFSAISWFSDVLNFLVNWMWFMLFYLF